MVLRWRASRGRDPLIIVLSCTHKCLALTHLFLKEKHTINKKQTPNGTSFNFHTMFKVFNLKTTFLNSLSEIQNNIYAITMCIEFEFKKKRNRKRKQYLLTSEKNLLLKSAAIPSFKIQNKIIIKHCLKYMCSTQEN